MVESPEVIVVGVDGSEPSRAALRYAASDAVRRGALLRVVAAFESAGVFGARYSVPIPVSDETIAHKIELETRALLKEVLDTLPAAPSVDIVVRPGPTGSVLVDESRRADHLVVGHRGLGDLTSFLLGSSGLHCVLHAHCTVTVVRHAESDDPVTATGSSII